MNVVMGSVERRERERQELRQKILDAARELFARRGYEAVTMREIAKRIEYSATAIYGHFADKEALVRELCHQDFARYAERFLAINGVSDPVERLCLSGLVYCDFARDYPEQFRVMYFSDLPPTPPQGDERDDPTQNAYILLRELVAELIRERKLRPELVDVDRVAQTVWAAVHGVSALDFMLGRGSDWIDAKPREERVAATLELVLTGLMREPERALKTLERVLEARRKGR